MAKLADTVTGARLLGSRIVTIKRRQNPEGRMPLMDHLRELRNRVLKAAAAIVVGMVAGLIPQVHDPLWNFIEHPFLAAEHTSSAKLVVIGVLDPFTIWLQVAFWVPVTIALALGLIQPIKGAIVAIQWYGGIHGFGQLRSGGAR